MKKKKDIETTPMVSLLITLKLANRGDPKIGANLMKFIYSRYETSILMEKEAEIMKKIGFNIDLPTSYDLLMFLFESFIYTHGNGFNYDFSAIFASMKNYCVNQAAQCCRKYTLLKFK